MPCDFSCPEFQTSDELKSRSSEVPARCPSTSRSEVKPTSDHFGGVPRVSGTTRAEAEAEEGKG
uniref:Uncharacterized protein n=1 Tax=Moniliophthora roreri TaxID=221103 RepID=A0A0W0G9V8_MONRR